MLHVDRQRLDRWIAHVIEHWLVGDSLARALQQPVAVTDPQLCLATHLACFTFEGSHLHGIVDRARDVQDRAVEGEAGRLKTLYRDSDCVESSREEVEERFRDFAFIRGVKHLRVLQQGSTHPPFTRWVFLGIDHDGIAKVWKEIDERSFDAHRWRQTLPTEDELFLRAQGIDGVVSFYGVQQVGEARFLRRAFVYGQSLLDFVRDGRRLSEPEASQVVGDLAKILSDLHRRGIVTGDLRPQNVRIDTQGRPILFDLGLGFFLGNEPDADHDAFVTDPRYLAPEMVWTHRMSRATEVFQLGMMFHQLLYGCEAFGTTPAPEVRTSYEWLTLRYGLTSALLAYEGSLPILKRMLDPNPTCRPTMQEVADELTRQHRVFIPHPPRTEIPVERERDIAIVPARIGLPHRGHIDLIARTMDLGYHAHISLQKAYTISEVDPYPKWMILKMVARSLIKLGYVPDRDFTFTLTRFFETDREHALHFAMLPKSEHVDVVVSGNPDVRNLFSQEVVNQSVFFGREGEMYQTRSWGSDLRRSVRDGDRKRFDELVACGVEEIISFEQLREIYARTPVEFVPAHERFELLDADKQILSGAVRRYGTLDTQIITQLRERGRAVEVLDLYARNTRIRLDGVEGSLQYQDGKLQTDGKLIVRISFEPDSE